MIGSDVTAGNQKTSQVGLPGGGRGGQAKRSHSDTFSSLVNQDQQRGMLTGLSMVFTGKKESDTNV